MLQITDWHNRYEVGSRGGKPKEGEPLRVGPLEFIRLNAHGRSQGPGYRRLLGIAGKRAMQVFGIFCKFLEIGGSECRDKRGTLYNESGNPATPEDLAFILSVPIDQIEHAIKVLCDKKVCWLINTIQLNTTQYNSTQGNGNSRKPRKFPETPEPLELAELLLSLILGRKPDFKQPPLSMWAEHVDKMIRLDNRKPTRIREIIRWCQADDFWQNNILSTAKLRKQFDKLELREQGEQKTTTNSQRQGASAASRQSQPPRKNRDFSNQVSGGGDSIDTSEREA